eukprot:TRINITY_DN12358_c0_g1_i2.p1 TRINITY_DN12358_c0_g1~~TRINITY_DN12358_c0_g1_i2.p1  ORF type:complete len:108 (-),score=20.34 TRINITY_DN12358_c0_g1_i2:11-334(-)
MCIRDRVYTLRDEQLTELERQYKALQSRFLRGVVERRNSLEPPTHVAVNHTSTRLPDDVSEHPEWRLNSVTHRFHDKYVTLKFYKCCLLYTSPSPRDRQKSRMPSSA